VVKKGTETRDWTYVDDTIDGLLAMGIKEEAVGEAINLGSGKEHRVIDMANMVNELTGQTLGKFNHQTFKKGLIQKRCAEAGIKYVERRDWDVKTRLLSSTRRRRGYWITSHRWNSRTD
jgi:nucleoside-diphosphate-sugar epimerase